VLPPMFIGSKDATIASHLGAPYRDCMRRTKRLIPFLA
jgi:protein-S-isoprenylcysteine O-methyltransferase Ste14